MAYYGRHVTVAEGDMGSVSANNARLSMFGTASEDMWVWRMGMWAGKPSGGATTPAARLAMYAADGSGNPLGGLMGYTGTLSPSAVMVSGGAGANTGQPYEGNVATVLVGTATAIQAHSGEPYGIAIFNTVAQLNHSMAAAGDISEPNEQFYDKSGTVLTPASNYSSYVASIEGQITVWAEYDANVKPETPRTSSMSPSGSTTSITPTMSGEFRDLNGTYGTSSGLGANRGDVLNRYQIQVYRVSDNVLMWDTSSLTPTAPEIAADAFSVVYSGTALVRGTAYKWRCRVRDEFSAWSSWSSYVTFTPASLGFVTLNGNPVNKIESITPNFEGRWNHQTALSTNAVQLFVYSNNILVATSPIIAKVVASAALPGTLFTITWAEAAIANLQWGKSYTYKIAGRDSSNNWSDPSAARSFNTNATPTTPSSPSPTSGLLTTTMPKISVAASDPDSDDNNALTVVATVTRPNATTVDITLPHVGNGRYEAQLTGTEITMFGVYSWRARAFDGTLYSGGTTVLGNAAYSTPTTFNYQSGPVPVITTPAEGAVLTAVSPLIIWSPVTNAVSYRVQIFEVATGLSAYDSGTIISAVNSHTVPSAYLTNGKSYALFVTVTDSTPLDGTSTQRTFSLSITPPATITNFYAVPVAVRRDPFPTSVQMTWTPYTGTGFSEYVITRRVEGSDVTSAIILTRLSSQTANAFTDYFPQSGVSYIYSIIVVTISGINEVSSVPAESITSVTLEGTVLCSVYYPETYRVVLHYEKEGRSHGLDRPESIRQRWSRRAPRTIRSPARYWRTKASYQIVSDSSASATQRHDDFVTMDENSSTLCQRDETGVKRFVTLQSVEDLPQELGWWILNLITREEDFTEGVD